MIHKFLKLIAAISIVLLSITSLSIADNHISKKEMISELRKEINELGEKPIKRKFLQGDTKFITALNDQKEEIEKEKAKKAKIDAVKEEIVKELDKLGEKPIADTKDIDTDEEIIARLSGRRVHEDSGRVYHVKHNPPAKDGLDDVTGEALIQRKDDKESTVRNRLKVYHDQTMPLVGFYQNLSSGQSNNTLTYNRIDGVGPLNEVQERLEAALA